MIITPEKRPTWELLNWDDHQYVSAEGQRATSGRLGSSTDTLLTYSYPNEEVKAETSLVLIVHHPGFGIALKEQLDKLGIECIVQYQDQRGGKLVRHKRNAATVSAVDFIGKQFRRAASNAKGD